MFISLLKTAWRDIWVHKGRALLTMLGVVIGITSVITILSVGQGVQRSLLAQIESYGQNLVMVIGGSSTSGGLTSFTGQIKTITWDDYQAMKNSSIFSHVKNFSSITSRFQSHIRKGNSDIIVPVQGNDGIYFDMFNYEIDQGRNFTKTEDETLARVAILAPGAKESLFGTLNPIGKFVRLNDVNFRIIGTLAETNTLERQTGATEFRLIYVPPQTAMKLLLGEEHLLGVALEVDEAENIDTVIAQVESFLRRKHQLHDYQKSDFNVSSMEEFIDIFNTVTDSMRLFLFAITAISLLVGGIGIMNVMLASVVQRTKEIGLRKAMGASNMVIILQFLSETVLLMSIGSFIGILFGLALSYTIAQYGGWPEQPISLISIPLAIGVAFVFGIVFGLYPAMKAAKMDPIEALKYE
jgi:putative ABC transport system permease protein